MKHICFARYIGRGLEHTHEHLVCWAGSGEYFPAKLHCPFWAKKAQTNKQQQCKAHTKIISKTKASKHMLIEPLCSWSERRINALAAEAASKDATVEAQVAQLSPTKVAKQI